MPQIQTQSVESFISKPCRRRPRSQMQYGFFVLYASTTKRNDYSLSFRESLGEALHVVLQGTVVGQELHVGTVHLDAASSLLLQVLLAAEGSEAPVLGDDDLLATGELILGSAEGLEGESTVCEIDLSATI